MPDRALNIGQAAARSGLSAKMIRHYEAIGLLEPAVRSASGYRLYSAAALDTLVFIKGARAMGFNLEAVAHLLALKRNPRRASADVQAFARQHIMTLDKQIESLSALRASLHTLVSHCQGDASPQCAILDELSASGTADT
jgi:MerR family copper efflux transcriptional regulator